MLSAFANASIFGERTGTGPPTVLALHGWNHSHASMAKVVDGFDAVSLDLPGHGASPIPSTVWGSLDYAEAVMPVLDEMQQPVVIVAHSFGGRIAVQLAAAYPEKVKALVLTGVPLIRHPSTGKPPLSFRLAKKAHQWGLLSDKRMEAERQKRGSVDYRAASGIMRDIFVKLVNESYEEQLRQISCPVELVWGENDTAANLEQAREAAAILADACLTVVPGATHWFPQEDPGPVREATSRCLA